MCTVQSMQCINLLNFAHTKILIVNNLVCMRISGYKMELFQRIHVWIVWWAWDCARPKIPETIKITKTVLVWWFPKCMKYIQHVVTFSECCAHWNTHCTCAVCIQYTLSVVLLTPQVKWDDDDVNTFEEKVLPIVYHHRQVFLFLYLPFSIQILNTWATSVACCTLTMLLCIK